MVVIWLEGVVWFGGCDWFREACVIELDRNKGKGCWLWERWFWVACCVVRWEAGKVRDQVTVGTVLYRAS